MKNTGKAKTSVALQENGFEAVKILRSSLKNLFVHVRFLSNVMSPVIKMTILQANKRSSKNGLFSKIFRIRGIEEMKPIIYKSNL